MSDSSPEETKLFFFYCYLRLVRRCIPARILKSLGTILFGISPRVPVNILSLDKSTPPVRAALTGAIITFLLCFIGTLVTTFMADTLHGADPQRLYFISDKTNLVNFAIICPAYVGFACALIYYSLHAWTGLFTDPVLLEAGTKRLPRLSIGMALFLIFLTALILTTNYIVECLDSNIYKSTAWYIDGVSSTGKRIIGFTGVYYILIIYSLFVVCITAVFSFILHCLVAAEIGRLLRAKMVHSNLHFEELKTALTCFTHSYIFAKLFFAALMINAFTWKWANPTGSVNLVLMLVFLSTIGVFIISFPRYYIEHEWHLYKVGKAEVMGEEVLRRSDDLRDRWIRRLAFILDLFFGLGFSLSVWGIV